MKTFVGLGRKNVYRLLILALFVSLGLEFGLFVRDIPVGDGDLQAPIGLVASLNPLRVILILLGTFGMAVWFLRWYRSERNERSLTKVEILFCVICFLYYFAWALPKGNSYPPDEVSRYDVTKFLMEHHRLPIKDELLCGAWGSSYAHLPTVLCNYLGYGFSMLASLISRNEEFLLRAARMPSVFCGAGAVYFLMKSGKIGCNPYGKWIVVVLVAAMPQFAFLSSYVNNDIVAFLGVTMILYAWLLGMKDNWNLKNAALLAVGISICALAYYNSYSWILFSIVFFYFSYFYKNRKDYKGARKQTVFIAGIVFVLIGYSFIRHLVIYGDLLGLRVTNYYREIYGRMDLKPSMHDTFSKRGESVFQMLFEPQYGWCKITWLSVIGIFGYMDILCPSIVYTLVSVLVLVGCIGSVVHLMQTAFGKQKMNTLEIVFYVCAVLSALVTIGLSIHYSYFSDYQPQGRYCYPAIPTLALIVGKGYEYLIQKLLKTSEQRYAACLAICTTMIVISIFVFYSVYLVS